MKLDGKHGFRVEVQRDETIDETQAIDGGFELAYDDAPVPFLLLREALRKTAEVVGLEYE